MIGSKGIKWQTRLGVLLPEHLAFTKLFEASEDQGAQGGAGIFADLHISINDLWAVFEENDKHPRDGSQPCLATCASKPRRIYSTLRLLKPALIACTRSCCLEQDPGPGRDSGCVKEVEHVYRRQCL